MFPVLCSVPLAPMVWHPLRQKKSIIGMLFAAFESHSLPFACYVQHFRATTFENHMLPTYDLRAVHIVTYNIYMFLLFLEYLYTSHRISLYYSAVAYHVLPALYPYIEPIYYL